MPVTPTGQVTSSGRGMAGLAAVWAELGRLFAVQLPALVVAIRQLLGQ